MSQPLVQATGRRKRAVARVRLRPGAGDVKINGGPADNYFPTAAQRTSMPPSTVAARPARPVRFASASPEHSSSSTPKCVTR